MWVLTRVMMIAAQPPAHTHTHFKSHTHTHMEIQYVHTHIYLRVAHTNTHIYSLTKLISNGSLGAEMDLS